MPQTVWQTFLPAYVRVWSIAVQINLNIKIGHCLICQKQAQNKQTVNPNKYVLGA